MGELASYAGAGPGVSRLVARAAPEGAVSELEARLLCILLLVATAVFVTTEMVR